MLIVLGVLVRSIRCKTLVGTERGLDKHVVKEGLVGHGGGEEFQRPKTRWQHCICLPSTKNFQICQDEGEWKPSGEISGSCSHWLAHASQPIR